MRRYHIFRQLFSQPRTEHFLVSVRFADVISHQHRCRLRHHQCHGLVDPAALQKPAFNLPELNAMPAQLDLEVVAPQEFDITCRMPAP